MRSPEQAFRAASPRFLPTEMPLAGLALSTAVAGFWIVAFYAAFEAKGIAAWALGVAFIAYDVALALFVAFQARKIWRASPAASTAGARPSVGVVVAAYNEAGALAATLDAILRQSEPPERVWIADDGSTDDSARVLSELYGLEPPRIGLASRPSPVAPTLRWLRLPHGGKAHALNAALALVDTDLMVTVDADTLLEPDAIAAIRKAFEADPDLVVGGGVLEPRCSGGPAARVMEAFQRLEYVRNFLSRFAWGELNALLLISGAFAAFRTPAVKEVGGFDPDSLVEDYELIHRLHRWGRDHGQAWRVGMVGPARASTDAPATVPAFLRQRRRWFAGFLQTHAWYRDMICEQRYGALGLAMLPVKTLDTMQPIYGLTAFALLLTFVGAGDFGVALPAGLLTLAKIGFDYASATFLILAYRRWTGSRAPGLIRLAFVALLIEPFSFQVLRHLGAARGWLAYLLGRLDWGGASRAAVVSDTNPEEGAAGA
jgi:cellulose synthase/poly-beta-1,6-N-acetylglucosamine synthase-like glycosyltransferase